MTFEKIGILGAGAIGCFVGGHWSTTGLPITLIGRTALISEIRENGLRFSGGKPLSLNSNEIKASDDPSKLSQCDLIVLTVKYKGLPEAISTIRKFARASVSVICLLNGIRPLEELSAALPDNPVIGGMVPFNVIWKGPDHLHRSSVGEITLEESGPSQMLAGLVENSDVPLKLAPEILPIQHGKLLLNLNNPINALSGLSLYGQLTQKLYRRIYAAVLQEALEVYEAAGIAFEKVGPLSPAMVIKILKSPNFIFNNLVTRIQKIDDESTTSMAMDMAAGRKTEISILNGEVVRLANQAGAEAPINSALVTLIRSAEEGGKAQYTAGELATILHL